MKYTLGQAVVLFGMAVLIGRMALDMDRLKQEGREAQARAQPMFQFARDIRYDISKSTFCMSHQNAFELHQISRGKSRYYGSSGALIRETDSGTTAFPLREGSVNLGMNYGMIVARVVWQGRLLIFGAPAGWAITREELLAQSIPLPAGP